MGKVHTRDKVDNQIDSADLVHELDTPGKKDSLAGLHFVVAEDLPEGLLANGIFKFNGRQDTSTLVDNELIIRLTVVYGTQNIDCFLFLTVVHEPSRGLREAEDQNDDEDGEDNLHGDG